jgi:hypothetical protein
MSKTSGMQDNLDYEVASSQSVASTAVVWAWSNVQFMLAGTLFGILLVKGEVILWFRIQEMFRFQSFHMYGVIGSAVLTGMVSIALLRKFKIRTFQGQPITISVRTFSKGNIYGGLLFGFGWALTGACPGPLFAQIGTGSVVVCATLLSAIAGTWCYGALRDKLPH